MTPSDVFVANGLRERGAVAEKGAVLLRPGYLVFVPDRARGGDFVGYAGRVLPPAFTDAAAYVRYLATLGEEDFDATVDDAVRRCGWLQVARGAARVVKRRALFRRHKVSLSFESEAETIRVDGPVDARLVPDVERLLASWA